jgi:TPR repeat protein
LARAIDLAAVAVVAITAGIAMAFTLPNWKIGTIPSALLSTAVFGVALLGYEAVALSLFGTTIGKAVFGLRVSAADGGLLERESAFRRAFWVWASGNGCYFFFPAASVFFWWRGFKVLTTTGSTSWDDKVGSTVTQSTIGSFRFLLGASVSVLLLLGSLVLSNLNKQALKQELRAQKNVFDQFDDPHSDIAAAPKSAQSTAPRDPVAERDSLQKRADGGDAEAQHTLAFSLMTGSSNHPIDAEKSAYYFKKAAEQGHSQAQYFLGNSYAHGIGVPKDVNMSAFWNGRAAEGGDANAQEKEGWKYFLGEGVPEDGSLAILWFSKAAQQGNVGAQRGLGKMYNLGKGVSQNHHLASVWFRKAAEQGDSQAQATLGVLYWTGQGVPVDLVHAYMWFNLAASSNDPNRDEELTEVVVKARKSCEKSMSRSQIEQAQALTRDWLATHKPWWGDFVP